MSENWAALFNETFSVPASVVHARVWREVFGDEYLPSLDTYSYVSLTELERAAEELRVGEGDRFATSAVVEADRRCGSPARQALSWSAWISPKPRSSPGGRARAEAGIDRPRLL